MHYSHYSDRKCAMSTQLLCPLLPTCHLPAKNQFKLDGTSGDHLVHHPTHSRANPHGVSWGETLSKSNSQGPSHAPSAVPSPCRQREAGSCAEAHSVQSYEIGILACFLSPWIFSVSDSVWRDHVNEDSV